MEESRLPDSPYIANCVFNVFLSYTAVMLNSVTIHAVRKTSSLPKPLKTLLLSMAVSDLGVGLIVQPLYVGLLVIDLKQNPKNDLIFNSMLKAFQFAVNLFCFASFFSMTALSLDRFLTIHLHLRYQEIMTQKRVVAVVILIWVFSAFLSLVKLWTPDNIIFIIFAIIQIACIITATLFNCKLYVAIRRHAHQIQVLQVQQLAQNAEMANVGRMRKYSITAVYLYLVFLVCYLPDLCMLWTNATTTDSSAVILSLSMYTVTLLFLNSSLNPLIYCWRLRNIRHAILNILRNASLRSHN